MKFGFDFHGVIDQHPQVFAVLTKALINDNHEVHIVTGSSMKDAVLNLELYTISYTHIFSITDQLLRYGYTHYYDKFGRPTFAPEFWNEAKGRYCKSMGIDLHFDDTEKYGDFFETDFALFKSIKRSNHE